MIAVGKEAEEEDFGSDGAEFGDWQMPLAFMKKRHTEAIEGSKTVTQSWRMKERVRLQWDRIFHLGNRAVIC